MNLKTLLWIASLSLALSGPAQAGGNHGHEHKPLHGGVVVESGDIDFELVAKPDLITLHLRDHGKPLSTQGGSVKLTMLAGSAKSELALQPAADNRFEAKGSFNIEPGTRVVAIVTLPGRKPASVRFALK